MIYSKPIGDWFSFAKVRKLCFLCYCKQIRDSSISQRLARKTDSGSECIMFEIWIFFLQKCMDLLRKAFIHALESCEACFIMDGCALFDDFWTVGQKHSPTAMIELRRARMIFNITLIGFV